MIPSLDGWPTKAKEAPGPHEVRLTLLGTNPVFLCLGDFAYDYYFAFDYLVSCDDLNQIISFAILFYVHHPLQ